MLLQGSSMGYYKKYVSDNSIGLFLVSENNHTGTQKRKSYHLVQQNYRNPQPPSNGMSSWEYYYEV